MKKVKKVLAFVVLVVTAVLFSSCSPDLDIRVGEPNISVSLFNF